MTNKYDAKKIIEESGMDYDKALSGIVKKSYRKVAPVPSLQEGYIAQQKVYGQVTEFATRENKSFHQDLYQNYIASLNKLSATIDASPKDDVNSRSSMYRTLKADESYNLNAVWLHELYFANCFDPHSTIYMDSPSYIHIQRQWGSFDSWQSDFMACAQASGNGYALLGMNIFLRQYVNTFVTGYSQDVMMGMFPILAIDCHEHAYFDMFFGDKNSFIVACMREINWDVIDSRIDKAEQILHILT
jgi:Fe-Mn family superoxide dismutase